MSVCLIYFTHKYKRQNETAYITRGDKAGTHHNPRPGLLRNAGRRPCEHRPWHPLGRQKRRHESRHTEDTQKRHERAVMPQARTLPTVRRAAPAPRPRALTRLDGSSLPPFLGLMPHFIQLYTPVESNTVSQLLFETSCTVKCTSIIYLLNQDLKM